MSNHQRANGPSHHDQLRRHTNDHIYSSDHHQPHESERQPPYSLRDRDPQSYARSYPRRRHNRFAQNDRKGYGGGTSSPFRGSHTPVPLRDLDSYSPYSPSASHVHDPDHPHRNDPYPDQHRNLVDPSSRPTTFSNNSYKGGCPYWYASNERQLPQPAVLTSHHESVPLPNKPRDTSSPGHGDPRPDSGPYKSICYSVSPLKQPSFRPRVKTETSSLAVPSLSLASGTSSPSPPDTALRTQRSDTLIPSSVPTCIALTSNERVQTDRRSSRTLSCEREETRTPHPTGLGAPIANPAAVPTDHTTDVARQSEQEQQHGPPRKTSCESNQMESGGQSKGSVKGTWQTVQRIFKKTPSRIPKWPDEKLTAVYAPPAINKGDSNAKQLKGVAEPVERTNSEMKLPQLRSVPVPTRGSKLENAPMIRLGAEARQMTHQGKHSEMIPKNDCTGLNGSRSPAYVTPSVPHASEARRTINSRQRSAARQNLASSIANMNIVDREENNSASERERSQGDVNRDENQRAGSNEHRQDRLLRGGNRGPQVSKRRATDFDGSRETRAKRQRPLPSSETVDLEETTAVRRSKQLQPSETTTTGEKKWETVAFDETRVLNLFSEQLRNQPMLLRLSFLGISDGDLRKTVDIWRGEKGLPEPSQRRLEINNNRIRRISGDMCECIASLRVVSLNLSCNLLTTIEGKIGLCSRLKFLNVSRNQLSSLPQELCDLTNLEVLNMSHNDISRLPPGLGRLKRLEVLSLAWNKLERLPEDVAAEGAVLSDLNLSHNEAFHFFPKCAEHWAKLEVLHISFTTILRSLSRKENRLRPAALVKELAGRKEDMFKSKKPGPRSQSL